MAKSKGSSRRCEIPIDYVAADPDGSRRERRLAARVEKAQRQGRDAGPSVGGGYVLPVWGRGRGVGKADPDGDRGA